MSENLPKEEIDKLKFMYDKVYDELNRCRDWPLKIMAFTSAFFFFVIGFVNYRKESIEIIRNNAALIILMLTAVAVWTIAIMIIQHYRYLDYRNTQIRLQIKLGVTEWKLNDKELFPKNWSKPKIKSLFTGFQGWFYYALYIFSFWLLTIIVVANL